MNLKEIRDDVRSLIIEPTPGFRTNTELNRWINQAHQLLGLVYKVEAFQQVSVTAGVTFNPLPEDLLVFKGAWTQDGRTIPIIPIASGNELGVDEVDELTIFRFGKNFVIVEPAPELQFESTITIFYERRPKMLIADTDEPDIDLPFHRYIVSYAVMRALQKDEDFEGATIYAQEFAEGMQRVSEHKSPIGSKEDYDRVLELIRAGVLNGAEAAEWLNIPLKKKIWDRVEVEEKGITLFSAGVLSKADLINNTEFPDKDEIKERLIHKASEFVPLPNWEDRKNGE